MKPTRAKEVLYDSETVLRLVERELQELRNDMAPPHKGGTPAVKGKEGVNATRRTARTSTNADATAGATTDTTPDTPAGATAEVKSDMGRAPGPAKRRRP